MLCAQPEGEVLEFIKSHINSDVEVLGKVKGNKILSTKVIKFSSFKPSEFYSERVSGVYQITYRNDQYLGSSVSVHTNLGNHIERLKGAGLLSNKYVKMLKSSMNSWSLLNFSLVYRTSNYADLAYKANLSLSESEKVLLRALTQFVNRILEQSLISKFRPYFNDLRTNVSFGIHASTVPNVSGGNTTGALALTIMDKGLNTLQTFPSINYAREMFNMSTSRIYDHLKSTSLIVVPPFPYKVVFANLLRPLWTSKTLGKPILFAPLGLPGQALTNLVPGAFWLFLNGKTDFRGKKKNLFFPILQLTFRCPSTLPTRNKG